MARTTEVKKSVVGTANVLRAVFETVQNPENWKLPTKPFHTTSKALAQVMCDAIVHFVGGVETGRCVLRHEGDTTTVYEVRSKGYYHYIGA